MLDLPLKAAGILVPFLLVLTLIIVVHELGHFLVARALGVKVDRFSIGFGRALASWRDRAGVEWRLAWIPVGGYVKFAGDADASGAAPLPEALDDMRRRIVARDGVGAERRYIMFKPLWARALISAAGPLANFLLAIVIFAALNLGSGDNVRVRPVVRAVEPGSPAAAAGFLPGDLVTRAARKRIDDWRQVQQVVLFRSGEAIPFEVQRGQDVVRLVATPKVIAAVDPITHAPLKLGQLGLLSSSDPQNLIHFHYTLATALQAGVEQTGETLGGTLHYIGRIFRGRESGDQFSGPVGIARVSGDVAKAAAHDAPSPLVFAGRLALNLIGLAGILSVGVGFANLLPIPVLDGGHLLFYAYEAVARRPVGERLQAASYRVGLAMLMALMLFVTWNDVKNLPLFQHIGGLLS